jgi:hypothetical protein
LRASELSQEMDTSPLRYTKHRVRLFTCFTSAHCCTRYSSEVVPRGICPDLMCLYHRAYALLWSNAMIPNRAAKLALKKPAELLAMAMVESRMEYDAGHRGSRTGYHGGCCCACNWTDGKAAADTPVAAAAQQQSHTLTMVSPA